VKPWVAYTLLRVGIFAAVFAALLLLTSAPWWLAAIIAAVVGLTVSYIFFGKLRDAVALDIVQRRARGTSDPDAAAEDTAG
jgi:tetrahydromethanopterin S-methyltransferase subunit C